MLTTVKDCILCNQSDDTSFITYYNTYIMCVQDMNIDSEFRHMINLNSLNVSSMDRLIQNTIERLKSI